MGISVIPCGGKVSIDRPALIFKSLGIPVYALWMVTRLAMILILLITTGCLGYSTER